MSDFASLTRPAPGRLFIKNSRKTFWIFLFSIYVCFTGCTHEQPVFRSIPAFPVSKTIPKNHFIAGYSIHQRPVECIVIGSGKDTILVIGSMHGDETAGSRLISEFQLFLNQNLHLLENKTIVFLPIANPDGVVNDRRFNGRMIDINRNFPSHNHKKGKTSGAYGGSEPETRIIMDLIRKYRPMKIVNLHEPLDCIDYDGPGEELANFIAEHCELNVRKLGARPGSLGSYAGEDLGIPVITLEFPRDSSNIEPEILWREYGDALIATIFYSEKSSTFSEPAGSPEKIRFIGK